MVVNDIQGAAETVDAIRDAGGEAIENTSDITTAAGTDRIVQDALDSWGRLDVVVNNAAAGGGTLPDEDTVRLTLGVHLVGTINLVRSAMPVFRQQRYGRIVNTGSGSVLGIPGTGIYAAGKGGVLAFSRVLANELASERRASPTSTSRSTCSCRPRRPRSCRGCPTRQFQAMLDTSFARARTSPLVAVLAHESCPVSGEAIQTGGGRVSRFVLATTEGWQAPDDLPTPESILEHWPEVMANQDLQEPVGSMSDLLGRRGLHPYNMADLVQWARTGEDPTETSDHRPV